MRDYIIGAAAVGLLFVGLATYKHSSKQLNVVQTTTTESVTTASATKTELAAADSVSNKKVLSVNLSTDNTIAIIGEIGGEAIDVAQAINEKAKDGKPIFLLINSPGGSVLDGVAIVSAMQAAKVPVYTVCLQLCASMAAIIFEAGSKRLMVDRSIVMFHEAAGGFQGQFNQMKSRMRAFDRLTAKLDYEIAKRVGIDPELFKSQLGNEIWLDAEDAVNQHFADGLVNANIEGASSASPVQQKSQTKSLFEKTQIRLMN